MKVLLSLALAAGLSAGCTQHTDYGKCIGIFDRETFGRVYEWSIWNAGVALVLSESLVVPVVWGFSMAKCPVARGNES